MFLNNVAFDLDGTLVDLISVFRDELPKMFPGYVMDNADMFHIQTSPVQLSKKQLWQVFDKVFPRVKDFPIATGARELLEALYEFTGDPIRVVTARPVRVATYTMQLLRRIADVPFALCMCDGHRDKIGCLKGVSMFVEDRRQTAIQLAEEGIAVFLINQPWNQEMPDEYKGLIKRIDGVETMIPWVSFLVKGE